MAVKCIERIVLGEPVEVSSDGPGLDGVVNLIVPKNARYAEVLLGDEGTICTVNGYRPNTEDTPILFCKYVASSSSEPDWALDSTDLDEDLYTDVPCATLAYRRRFTFPLLMVAKLGVYTEPLKNCYITFFA